MKLEVVLEHEGRLLSGSTIWEIRASSTELQFPRQGTFEFDVRGEAMPLQVDEQRALFVLRRRLAGGSTPSYGALLIDCGISTVQELEAFEGSCDVRRLPEVVLASGDLGSDAIPDLQFGDDGPIARGTAGFRSVRVSVSNDPPAFGIKKRYPWIGQLPEPKKLLQTDPPGTGIVFRDKLYRADFVRGENASK